MPTYVVTDKATRQVLRLVSADSDGDAMIAAREKCSVLVRVCRSDIAMAVDEWKRGAAAAKQAQIKPDLPPQLLPRSTPPALMLRHELQAYEPKQFIKVKHLNAFKALAPVPDLPDLRRYHDENPGARINPGVHRISLPPELRPKPLWAPLREMPRQERLEKIGLPGAGIVVIAIVACIVGLYLAFR